MNHFAGLCAAICVTSTANAQESLSKYTEDVLVHILTHEIGHALIREFDLPVLTNEEVMADDFATTYIVQNMPDRALDIITARAQSWELEMDEETVFSEYPDDVWRAGQMICLAYGLDPDKFQQLAIDSGISEAEGANCRDRATEIGRAWRRIIAPLVLPSGAPVTEVAGRIGEGPWREAFIASNVVDTMQPVLEGFDWHSQITFAFDQCDQGAFWSRNGRQILLCDNLIARFEDQSTRR